MHRVVVTGFGAVTPFGYGVDVMMRGIAGGVSCVRHMDEWDTPGRLRTRVGAPAELKDEKSIARQKRRSMSRMSLFAVQAAESALRHARLETGDVAPGRLGCIVGSTMGSPQSINEFFDQFLSCADLSEIPAMLFFKSMSHTAAMNIGQYFGITGTVMATCAACASGLQAIGTGYRLLQLGTQDVFLCGGTEELHPSVAGTFDILQATSVKYNDDPARTPRPFDADRDGIVCGEGAGIVVLETYEHAKARGAAVLAEVAGFNTCGSGDHVSQSNRESMARCMQASLDDAGMKPGEIGYISAHATATDQGDRAEAEAIADVFGGSVPVSSLKGYMGHTLGASGAIELAATIMMMQSGTMFPGMNLENVAADCGGINHLREAVRRPIAAALKNCFAFGGVNSSLIVREV